MTYMKPGDSSEVKEYAEQILQDYEQRRRNRMGFELQWQLNMNFVGGNQHCFAAEYDGQIYSEDKRYEWQENEVFNHIAPIVDARMAKLGRIRPLPVVRPVSGDQEDEEAAKVSTTLLQAVARKLDLSKLIEEATHWSELCGTSFYKITWNKEKGRRLGKSPIREGDVQIEVCPPFEIFPDDAACESIQDCQSIIHARAVSCDEAKMLWDCEPEEDMEVEVFSLDCRPLGGINGKRTVRNGHLLVLEKYVRPNREYPEGRLSIVAGGKLVYDGPLPYINGEDETRGLPFVRQTCNENPGLFWGSSVVERCIPIQRAYNAVKNRKHEYLARTACGVLAAEEGAVDTARLEDEGLEPGGILIYRSGSPIPSYIEPIPLPGALMDEENALLNEFILVSGVSELARTSYMTTSNISGIALEMLAEQDDTRLSVAAEHIRSAVAEVSQNVLRLYRQFAVHTRMERIVGENGSVALMMWNASMLNSDDVEHDTENELSQTVSERRKMVLELMSRGIFNNSYGQIDERAKSRILQLLGFGQWEDALDMNDLHIEKAKRENLRMENGKEQDVSEIDQHQLHIAQHIKYMLNEPFEYSGDEGMKERFLEHIRQHKTFIQAGQEIMPVKE